MVDKPLPGCAEGCVLLLLDDSVDEYMRKVKFADAILR